MMFKLLRKGIHTKASFVKSNCLKALYKIFQSQFDLPPTTADVLTPIHDIVIDYNSRYYAAVPLDFREEDYTKWLEKRTGPLAAKAIFRTTSENLCGASRYLSSVFPILELNGLVELVDASYRSIEVSLIKQKLDQQGSVYAQADAFRLYCFRKKAWAQLLMQFAREGEKVEEQMLRHKKEGRWERPPAQIPLPEGKYRGEIPAIEDDPDIDEFKPVRFR